MRTELVWRRALGLREALAGSDLALISVIWRRFHPALGFGGGIVGHASNFRCVQRRSDSDFAIVCDLSLLNTLPGRFNLSRVRIDAKRIRPRLAFTDCAIADVVLEPGIEQRVELRTTLILDKDIDPRETIEIVLTTLKIYAVDAFRGRHRLSADRHWIYDRRRVALC